MKVRATIPHVEEREVIIEGDESVLHELEEELAALIDEKQHDYPRLHALYMELP